jgi:hypothetical protein
MSRVGVPSNSLSGSASPPGTGLNSCGDRSSTLEMPHQLRLFYTASAVEVAPKDAESMEREGQAFA